MFRVGFASVEEAVGDVQGWLCKRCKGLERRAQRRLQALQGLGALGAEAFARFEEGFCGSSQQNICLRNEICVGWGCFWSFVGRRKDAGMGNELLRRARIFEIYQTAIDLNLVQQREALLSGLTAAVRNAMPNACTNNISQLLSDLNWLNQQPPPKHGEASYLEMWIQTALRLGAHDPRCAVFREACNELQERSMSSDAGSELSHTSIVLDRLVQWKMLIEYCENAQEHLVFLVHGTKQNAPGAFVRRVGSYLLEDCNRKHRVLQVQRSGDGTSARSADEWQRCLIRVTEAGGGELGPALEKEATKLPVLFLLLDKDGPILNLDAKSTKELGNFFKGRLNDSLAARAGRFRNPLRFVIPIEHAPTGSAGNETVISLSEALKKADKLRFVPLKELNFPPWSEVEDWLVERYGGNDQLLAKCRDIYHQNTHSVTALGDQLHGFLLDWEEDNGRQ